MDKIVIENTLKEDIVNFSLPRYSKLTGASLFLEQTVELINSWLKPLGVIELTSSMVSNYVKQRIIPSPIKKQYGQEQLAYLFFVAIAKTVAPLEDIKMMIDMQKQTYSVQEAYDYLCKELENVLQYIFGNKDCLEEVGETNSELKELLRNMIITIAHKIHFVKYLELVKSQMIGE
ncbi:MAG: DUF1836 domain-containing protein [Lachnospiraceae bacterium]|nr:DUF1836 domain-containing protein [Lachnospiraceae bacterium]